MQLSRVLSVLVLAVTLQGCSKKQLDPCLQDACSGHGTCYAGPNNRPMCDCESGYEDVGLTCVANCFAVDCSNLGGCLVQDNEPVCVCDQGYQGVGLECRPAPETCGGVGCSGYGVCVDLEGQPACICQTGYVPFGLSCVPASCTGVTCSNHGACLMEDGSPSCQCDQGFVAVGLSCQPSDCSLTDCSGHGACLGAQGEARCECDQGYVAVGLECRPAPCEQEDCSGHGACVEGSSGLECVCDPGYVAVGLSCRPRCSNVDCSGHGACVQEGGGVRCLCDPGYVVQGQSCVRGGPSVDGGVDGGVPGDGGADGSGVDAGAGDGGEAPDGGNDAGGSVDSGPDSGGGGWGGVTIPGGTYQMGATDLPYAQPIHPVTLPTFELRRTEVTIGEYAACVTAGQCSTPLEGGYCNWNSGRGDNQPANCVSWEQAKTYCAWIGGRLPSESEWEYAARSGGQDYLYPWGNETATCALAVMSEGGTGCGTGYTMAVCSRPAGNSAQGLCDLAGNVWEWLEDDWHDDYTGAPGDGSAWVDDPRASNRVVRGGAFYYGAGSLRAASRSAGYPFAGDFDIGFRCARDAP